MLRTVLAVVAGYIASAMLTMTGFALLTAIAGDYVYQRLDVLIGLVVYGVICAALGGWVAARVAQNRPVQHALYLGGVMIVFGILSFMGPSGGEPLWFKLALIIVALPSAWVGGRLREKQLSGTAHG